MPPASAKTRRLLIALWLPVAASVITCIVLPILGARSFHTEFRQAYSAESHLRLLAPQLPGPIFTLLTSSAFLLAVIFRKRLPWWLWLVPLLGVVYTRQAVRGTGLSHDFSHTVFNECSSIYGTWISSACIIAAAALLASAAITRHAQRLPAPPAA